MENQTEIKKIYVNLSALKNNLPEGGISTKYVNILHNGIDSLIKLGFDNLNDFKIPEREQKFRISPSPFDNPEEKFVEREFFLLKLDALLSFFTISQPEIEIGFKAD